MTANGMAGLPAGPTEERAAAHSGAAAAADMAVPQKDSVAVRGDADAQPAFSCLGVKVSDCTFWLKVTPVHGLQFS